MNSSRTIKVDGAGESPGSPALHAAESLTPQEFRFMLALQRALQQNPEVRPTFEDLRRAVGLASKSGVARLVEGLIAKGRIAKGPFKSRSLQVLVPVVIADADEDALKQNLLKSFSDRELLIELGSRGYVLTRD